MAILCQHISTEAHNMVLLLAWYHSWYKKHVRTSGTSENRDQHTFFLPVDATKSWGFKQSYKIEIQHILYTTDVSSSHNGSQKSALYEKKKKGRKKKWVLQDRKMEQPQRAAARDLSGKTRLAAHSPWNLTADTGCMIGGGGTYSPLYHIWDKVGAQKLLLKSTTTEILNQQ